MLRSLTGLVVLDEIQTQPQLFPLLRVLADRVDAPARFLILGSAAPELLRNASESLAGRAAFHERDRPQLGVNLPALTLRRFWTMLGHYHPQTWNGSELARALGVSDKTVSRYLDIL